MDVISNDEIIIADPNDEVKKLQDLVKKLELQNVELRRKQCVNEFNEQKKADSQSLNSSKSNDSSLDAVDIIDINELEDLSDEDSWLFSPPRELTPEQRNISPYKWMRSDLEDGNDTDLQYVRKSLVNKLDEIIRVSPFQTKNQSSIQLPSKSSYRINQSPIIEKSKDFVPCNNFSGQSQVQKIELSTTKINHCPPEQRVFDSRTFTRPKKRRELFPPNESVNIESTNYSNRSESPVERLQDQQAPPEFDEISSVESSMTASGLYKFHGVEEVQELARMQEESLRLSSSATSSPKHGSSHNSQEHLSYHINEDGLYVNHVDVGEYAQSKIYHDDDSDSYDQSSDSSPLDVNLHSQHSQRKGKQQSKLSNLKKSFTVPERQNTLGLRQPMESQTQCDTNINSGYFNYSSGLAPKNTNIGGLNLRQDNQQIPHPQAVSSLRNKTLTRNFNSSPIRKSPTRETSNQSQPSKIATSSRSSSRLPTPKSRSQLPISSNSKLPQRMTYNRDSSLTR